MAVFVTIVIFFCIALFIWAIIDAMTEKNRKQKTSDVGKKDIEKAKPLPVTEPKEICVKPREIKEERSFEETCEADEEDSDEEESLAPAETCVEYPLVGLFVIKTSKFPAGGAPVVGKITAQEGKFLTIEGEEKRWQYPELFLTESMRFGDPELQEAFDKGNLVFKDNSVKICKNMERTQAPPLAPVVVPPAPVVVAPPVVNAPELSLEEALHMINRAPIPVWVTSSFPGDMQADQKLTWGRHYGTRGRDIYQNGCDVFGWDQSLKGHFAMMKDMYAYCGASGRKSIWMLPNLAGVAPIAKKKTASWWNTFTRDLVFEEWKKPTDDFYNDDTQRITFAKNKGNSYVFIGVYEPVQRLEGVDNTGEMHYIKVYRRIADSYEG